MVDSRQKGARAEAAIVKLLKQDTKLNWKRVPGSGALHEDHGLKGDVYVPNEHNYFSIEVKHYKEPQFSTKILTDKNPTFLSWWGQAQRQANQTNKKPILFFKHDRSEWFVALRLFDARGFDNTCKGFNVYPLDIVVMQYSEFKEKVMPYIEWIKE